MMKIMVSNSLQQAAPCFGPPVSAILKPNMNKPPFAIPSFIFLLLAVPLVLGRIPQNRFYGVRTRKTLSNKRVWFAVNKLAGRLIITSSLIYLSIAALVPSSSDVASTSWWVHLGGFVLPLVVSVLIIHSYIKRF